MEDGPYTLGGQIDVVALLHLEPANDNHLPSVELTDAQRRTAFAIWLGGANPDNGLGVCPAYF